MGVVGRLVLRAIAGQDRRFAGSAQAGGMLVITITSFKSKEQIWIKNDEDHCQA
jgi:hypothetical protein